MSEKIFTAPRTWKACSGRWSAAPIHPYLFGPPGMYYFLQVIKKFSNKTLYYRC